MALAQATAQGSGQNTDPSLADQVKALQAALAAQQAQIAQQQDKINSLEKTLAGQSSGTARVENASLVTPTPAAAANKGVSADYDQEEKPKESPLSFRIGGTEFTPGGWVDFENVFRSTNTGNVTATNFWSIPFSNTPAGHLSEYRSTAQYTRFSLKVNGTYLGNNVTGYIEADFNGNDAQNVFVTSNPHTARSRLLWLDVKRGKWEFLGGSTWGLQTANRVGVSPVPSDVFTTIGEDSQTHVGINYTRATAFRVAYHANSNFVWAFELQNPQQFIGQGNEVIFPAQFNANTAANPNNLSAQFDNANNAGVPNAFPDIITKAAYDKDFSGRHLHFEIGGLLTSVKITNIPSVAGATFVSHSAMGGGVIGGINVELVKGFRFLGSGMWGPGVGRYAIGMGPQAIVVPVAAAAGSGTCLPGATGGCDAHISPVHSGDLITGFELQAAKNTVFGAYYGGAYFQRNTVHDLTVATLPMIGFGGVGEAGASGMNRAIQEGSFDWTQTFWRNPQYGALVLITQGSYVTRAPWVVPAATPKNAHLVLGYVSLRYILP
jgi:hypothetical protein